MVPVQKVAGSTPAGDAIALTKSIIYVILTYRSIFHLESSTFTHGRFKVFIQIEGMDGVGKTTQCLLLRDWMIRGGTPAIIVKELESTNFGKKAREILVQGALNTNMAEMFLFLASKAQAFSEVILPALAKGECVISDRGDGSFISYNSSLGLDLGLLLDLLNIANLGTTPNLTILLDLPVEDVQKRIALKATKSRFDLIDKLQLERQKRRFLELSRTMPNWVVLDGTRTIEDLHQQITQEVQKIRRGN